MSDCPTPLKTHIGPQKLVQHNVIYPQSSQEMSTGSSEGRHRPVASICTEARRTRGPKALAATSSKGKSRGPRPSSKIFDAAPCRHRTYWSKTSRFVVTKQSPYAAGELYPWLDPMIENPATSPVPFSTDWQTPAGQSTLKTEDTSYYRKHSHPQSIEATTTRAPRETGPPGPATNEGQDPEADEPHNLSDNPEGRRQPREATPALFVTHRVMTIPQERPARHQARKAYPAHLGKSPHL